MLDDLRYALRGFRKTPAFTAVALLTLTLAIGANTALFSLLNALLLRDLPVRDPAALVLLRTVTATNPDGAFSLPMFREIAARQRSFSAVIGWLSSGVLKVEIDREEKRAAFATVTGNYFSELGVRPVVGRLLADLDDDLARLRAAPVAVLGYSFWQRQYGGDPAVVGCTIRAEGVPLTIVGVAPEGFTGFNVVLEPDVTVPLTLMPQMLHIADSAFTAGWTSPIRITGRLRPGVTIEEARAELMTIWPAIRAQVVPPSFAGAQRERFLTTRIEAASAARGIETRLRDRYTRPLLIVLAIAAMVLLIACVNLASLMLSRAAARTHEVGVRLALGAGRWRLARQLLVEGVLLSLAGAALGILFAYWSSDAIVTVMFRDYLVPAQLDVTPDVRVLAFTTALAFAAGIGFSLASAWRATRASPIEALQQSARTSTGSRRASTLLVAAQVGLSLMLLTNAGLLVRSLQEIRGVPSGMQSDDVFVTYPGPRSGGYPAGSPGIAGIAGINDMYYQQVIQRLLNVPGVERASISLSKPAGGGSLQTTPIAPVAETDLLGRGAAAIRSSVAPGFFDTLGITMIGGRDFTWRDSSTARHVAIVSQSLARTLFGGTGAIGQRIRVGVRPDDQDVEVVGIVGDARLYDLKSANLLAAYTPALQDPNVDYKCFVIRGRSVSSLAVKRSVEALGREQIGNFESLSYITGRTLLQERMTAALAGFFGGLALLLAGIGLYGLMTYAVTQRQREIGIRMALGAEPVRVMTAVIRDGVAVTLGGVSVGFLAALGTSVLVKSLLFGITNYDPLTLFAAPTSLIVITVVACVPPAVRAARVDPMLALHAE